MKSNNFRNKIGRVFLALSFIAGIGLVSSSAVQAQWDRDRDYRRNQDRDYRRDQDRDQDRDRDRDGDRNRDYRRNGRNGGYGNGGYGNGGYGNGGYGNGGYGGYGGEKQNGCGARVHTGDSPPADSSSRTTTGHIHRVQ